MIDWEQIVEAHGPLVWRTAQRLLHHEAEAADCFQRTFLSALDWVRTKPDVPIRHWPAFLKQIATSRALEQLRKQIREQNRFRSNDTNLVNSPISEIDELIDTSLLDSATITSGNELAEHLRNALAAIDSRQAEIFCLACLEDCTYQEIAEQLEITVSNVGALLSRARAELRDKLKAHDPKRESKFIDHG